MYRWVSNVNVHAGQILQRKEKNIEEKNEEKIPMM